jgi:DNA polymerase III gamma/tau subunit
MESFLILARNSEKLKAYAYSLFEKEKIDKIDINLIESEKQIGISAVREFQKKIYLKPYKSKQKGIILNAENGITTEAQNALLKVLEEPPVNTIIIMLSKTGDLILPTIISRCKVINLKEDKREAEKNFEEFLLSLPQKGIGEKLKLAEQNSKTKENALDLLENLLIAGKKLLEENQNKQLANSLKELQKTYNQIKNSNVNIRLSLENLFLSF